MQLEKLGKLACAACGAYHSLGVTVNPLTVGTSLWGYEATIYCVRCSLVVTSHSQCGIAAAIESAWRSLCAEAHGERDGQDG